MNLDALTAVELAKLFDVTEKTIRNWMNKNGLPFSDTGRTRTVAWSAAFQWYIKTQVGTSGNSGKIPPPAPLTDDTESYEDALARKTRAEANLKELQLAKERGQVASLPDVERVLAASTMATQTQVLAVPSRLATRMLGLEEHAQAVAILDAEMRQLLTNLASIDAVREASGSTSEDD